MMTILVVTRVRLRPLAEMASLVTLVPITLGHS
jgi:hypothetical protein